MMKSGAARTRYDRSPYGTAVQERQGPRRERGRTFDDNPPNGRPAHQLFDGSLGVLAHRRQSGRAVSSSCEYSLGTR